MGTQDPLVRIEAATLAGGDNNQDRYAYGDGWAFVLDGASSFSETPPVHDGGWYAERLKDALVYGLTNDPQAMTSEIVAQSISMASAAHQSTHGPCPTSTIALARWDVDQIQLYLLGDSHAVTLSASDAGRSSLEDSRIDLFGSAVRARYESRLRKGGGFTSEHRKSLAELQHAQSRARNQHDGYWIAGDQSRAAYQAIIDSIDRENVARVALFSDGLTTIYSAEQMSEKLAKFPSPFALLETLYQEEEDDPQGARYPRAKPHDDKTLVTIDFSSTDPERLDANSMNPAWEE